MENLQSNNPYLKICKLESCGEAFIAKRLNEEYHSKACKNRACNNKASKENSIINAVNLILKRDWRILNTLFASGKTIIQIDELFELGFDYMVQTGLMQDTNGEYIIPKYYNYALEQINEHQFKIHKL